MTVSPRSGLATLLPALLLTASCRAAAPGPAVVRPGAPGEESRVEQTAQTAAPRTYSPADVHFVHGMIAHHEQALVMSALVPERSARDDMKLLAQRIERSQTAEIARMKRWLAARSEPVAGMPHLHMPGMLTDDELTRLRNARGVAFDRLFLELMIKHHEGALRMVADLFAGGAGREPELYQFAADVDADQRGEIARMQRLLSSLLP